MTADSLIEPVVEKKGLSVRAAQVVRQRILTGELAPGTRLKEQPLAAELELSRGTVRAALHQLAFEGLVTQEPYAGWSVATLSPRDAWENHSIRAVLEGLAARLAAEAPENRRDELRVKFNSLEDACSAGDQERMMEADLEFHTEIVEIANHARLARHYEIVRQQARIFVMTANSRLPRPASIVEQHRPLAEAVCAGDRETAEALAIAHNEQEMNRLWNLMEKEPEHVIAYGRNMS